MNFIELASVPSKPTDVPQNDPEVTNDQRIKVTYANPAPYDGGSPIISYELAMDDGMTGNFTSLVGYEPNSLLKVFTIENDLVIKGRNHRFRYRAKNVVGWSDWSDDAFVLAARVPYQSDRPQFSAFADGVLSILIPRSLDNGGTPILSYELWVDAGNNYSSEFTQLTNYNDNGLIYQATALKDSLKVGKTYRFKSRTVNAIGESAFSIYGYIAFGDVPTAPDTPSRVFSSETQIKV